MDVVDCTDVRALQVSVCDMKVADSVSSNVTIPSLEQLCAEVVFNYHHKSNILDIYSIAESIYNTYLIKKCRDIVSQRFPFYLERYGEKELSVIIGSDELELLMNVHHEQVAAKRWIAQKV